MKWSGETVAMVDMLLAVAIVFMALSTLVPPPSPPRAVQDKSICVLAVDVTWPDDNNADVDLWAKGPGDPTSIGYAHKDNTIGSLVKDDMGDVNDQSGHNSERICFSSAMDGEYIVNLMLYDLHSGSFPVETTITISLVDAHAASMQEIYSGSLSLTDVKSEHTVVRFTLRNGTLLTGSENNIPTEIVKYSE